MKMNKKLISLTACALVLVAVASVKPVMAYFTDSVSASGNFAIALDDTKTDIYEGYTEDSMVKVITISNPDVNPCWTRVKVVLPDGMIASVEEGSSAKWSLKNGYYEYAEILQPDAESEDLILKVNINESAIADSYIVNGESVDTFYDFNVIVIPESTKVLYGSDGNALAADWSLSIYKEPTSAATDNEGGNE